DFMRISLACNWKLDLLNHIQNETILSRSVHDLYGTTDLSFTGSGRPFLLMPKREKSDIETYINKVHDLNLKFTWLWNGQCLGYFKFNSNEQTKALKELDWLDDMDVEYLTVSDPYLAEFAKNYHPRIKLKVSVIAEVNSLSRALEWQEIIGSEGVLTLSIMLNRDFPLLKEIKKAVKCDIELLTNDCCLYECPFRFFHYTECSHASQIHDVLEGYYNDWATIACQNQKSFYPEQILMCRWIQPTDLDKYIKIGIDYFKISGRRYGTNWLFKTLKAYCHKSYNGNLGEIFNGYSFVSDPLELAGAQFSEFATKQEKIGGNPHDIGIMLSVPAFKAELKSNSLDDFIQNFPFNGTRCSENCGISCNYCKEAIKKAYYIPSEENAESYRNFMAYFYDYLNLGEIFLQKEKRKLKSPVKEVESDTYIGISWTYDAKEFFEEAMKIVPKDMQQAAKQGIGFTAERTAERQGLSQVDKNLIISIIVQLVPQPFKHDVLDFLIEKDIDPLNCISNEDINFIKSLPYGTELMAQKAKERGLIIKTPKFYLQNQKEKEVKNNMDTKKEWEEYLTKYMEAFNDLPDLEPLLDSLTPLIFQFFVTDREEMNYWQFVEKDKLNWGMGEYSGPDAPKISHKTDFNTLKKTLSGETDPIQATMAGTYVVEGDMSKLMACAPLLPLNAKAHAKINQE
ncbi:MAG: U32 family peptidase, partial [Promethearchaeota archaeon]